MFDMLELFDERLDFLSEATRLDDAFGLTPSKAGITFWQRAKTLSDQADKSPNSLLRLMASIILACEISTEQNAL